MSTLAQYKEVLRAMLKGDTDQANQISSTIGDAPWRDSGMLLTSVCALLAEHRFESDDSPSAIKGFVDEMVRNYAAANPPLKPFMCEVTVRVALGEANLLQGIDVNDLAVHQMAFMNKVVHDAEMSGQQIDELVDEAEAMVNEL